MNATPSRQSAADAPTGDASADPFVLLALDVGNTRTKAAVFVLAPNPRGPLPRCCWEAAWPTREPDLVAWIKTWQPTFEMNRRVACLASVNPRGSEALLSAWPTEHWPLPIALKDPSELPLGIDLAEPESAGMDRLLNAVAARVLRPDRPLIIVSAGTATTVDFISADGVFRGGAILPGLELAARSLHKSTALLPLIPLRELNDNLPALGRSTPAALRSGLLWGHVGSVQYLATRMAAETRTSPEILVTGGAGKPIAARLWPSATYLPGLALKGLAVAYAHRYPSGHVEAQPPQTP